MLTLPKIEERSPQPYLFVSERIALNEMRPAVDRAFGKLFGWLGENGLAPSGAAFFKYNLMDGEGRFDIEFCVPVDREVAGGGDVRGAVLPAGRYAQVTWTGPYDALFDVNAVLAGWSGEKGLRHDTTDTAEGRHYSARIEIYENNPAEVKNPDDLVTTVAIKLVD